MRGWVGHFGLRNGARSTAVKRYNERWCFWASAYQCACNQIEDDTLVGSRGRITVRPSLLDFRTCVFLRIRLPTILGGALCHVDVVMAAFMDCYQILLFPVMVVSVVVMDMYSFVI